MKPSMPQFLKCMAPVDLSVNCTALDERLTVSADMEKEGVWLRNISQTNDLHKKPPVWYYQYKDW